MVQALLERHFPNLRTRLRDLLTQFGVLSLQCIQFLTELHCNFAGHLTLNFDQISTERFNFIVRYKAALLVFLSGLRRRCRGAAQLVTKLRDIDLQFLHLRMQSRHLGVVHPFQSTVLLLPRFLGNL